MKNADRENVNYILGWDMPESERFFCVSHYFHFRASGQSPDTAWRMLIRIINEAYHLNQGE